MIAALEKKEKRVLRRRKRKMRLKKRFYSDGISRDNKERAIAQMGFVHQGGDLYRGLDGKIAPIAVVNKAFDDKKKHWKDRGEDWIPN